MNGMAFAALAAWAALLAAIQVLTVSLGILGLPLTSPIAAQTIWVAVVGAALFGWRIGRAPAVGVAPSQPSGWLRRVLSVGLALAAVGFAVWTWAQPSASPGPAIRSDGMVSGTTSRPSMPGPGGAA